MKNIIYYMRKNLENRDYVLSYDSSYKKKEFKVEPLLINDVIKFTNFMGENVGKFNYNKKIGILMNNCNNFLNSFYASILNGYIVVPINYEVSDDELNFIIENNNLDCIITNDKFENKVKSSNVKSYINLDEIDYKNESTKLNLIDDLPTMDDTMVISSTSGTSGKFSKGVLLTYRNISFVSEQYREIYNLNEKSKIITVLPLWHNYAMFSCLTSSIVAKSTMILMDKWNASLFMDINHKLNPDVFPGSPYMYIDLIKNYHGDLSSLSHLKICDSGGDSLPISCIKEFEDKTGAVITEGYGLTETTSLTHFNYSAEERKVGSLGKAIPGIECKILDTNGNELGNNKWGLLWLKGDSVFKGYVNRDCSDVKTDDGWFNTEDVVKRDNDGYYYLAGRFTDLHSIDGDEQQLRLLENKLYNFEGIKRVHVVAKLNDLANFYSFDIVAELQENYTIKDLYDYINLYLKNFVIDDVKIVDKLPTTGTGKIKRKKIREIL